ncbi:MAG: hypothetical protein JWM16_5064 [Verrucomicrobiales bacterium]|nr:hypothetical protein [Verrucomicrobiales bacterium]
MELFDRFLRFISTGHFHKTEAARAAGRAVLDDVDRENSPGSREMILQIIF